MKWQSRSILFLTLFVTPFAYALTDPTRPPPNINAQANAISSSAFVLSGIINSKERKLAVINGSFMKIGDELFGARITNITNDSVHLDGPNGKLILFLAGKPIKSAGIVMCKREFKLCAAVKN